MDMTGQIKDNVDAANFNLVITSNPSKGVFMLWVGGVMKQISWGGHTKCRFRNSSARDRDFEDVGVPVFDY